MRGFFAIGVESLSKQMNAGNLFRSAHAFGASFVFTIGGIYSPNLAKSNTSKSIVHMRSERKQDSGIQVRCHQGVCAAHNGTGGAAKKEKPVLMYT